MSSVTNRSFASLLLLQNSGGLYRQLLDLSSSLTQLYSGLNSTSSSRVFPANFDTPLGAQFRLDGKVNAQAAANANDALAALSGVSTSLSRQSSILGELQTLATTAADTATTRAEREDLQAQAVTLVEEYNTLSAGTSYNQLKLMDGSNTSFSVQLGYGTTNQFTVGLNRYTTRQIADGYSSGVNAASAATFSGTRGNFSSADLNGDGRDDLLVQDSVASSQLSVALSTAAGLNGGGVETAVAFSAPVADSTLADINGDGALDIVAATSGGIQAALGNGDGTFAASAVLAGGSFSTLEAMDTNRDGSVDIIALSTSGDLSNLVNGGGGVFSTSKLATGISGVSASATGDIDGDGYGDLGIVDSSGTLYSLLGAADGSLSSQATMGSVGGGVGSYELVAAEFNGDGRVDFALAGPSTSAVFFTQSNRTVSAANSFALTSNSRELSVADLNGDGRTDILARTGESTASIFSGNGSGGFTAVEQKFGGDSLGYADINGDSILDLVGGTTSLYVTGLATPQTTTAIRYLDLTTKQGADSALSAVAALESTLALETGSVNGSKSILGAAKSSLTAAANANYGVANRMKEAYFSSLAPPDSGSNHLARAFSEITFTSALIRSLLSGR